MKKFYLNHQEIINYLIIGILTTIISLLVKVGLLLSVLNPDKPIEVQIAVITSWIIAVTFAYITNRVFVFKSKSKEYLKEIINFVIGRIFTLLLDMFIMWFILNYLDLNTKIWTQIASLISLVVVIVLNYVISKIFVFKNK